MSTDSITIIVANSVIVLTLIIKGYWDNRKALNLAEKLKTDREQDRADRELELQALKDGFETVNDNGTKRLKAIIQSNVTTREYAKKAIDSANDTTGKFTETVAAVKQVLQKVNLDPVKVEVTNDAAHPIPTETVNQ